MKSIILFIITLSATSSAFGAMTIAKSGSEFTFTFVPAQTAPLPAGFASYTSGDIGVDRIISWTGYTVKEDNVTVISNTLIDATGVAVPDAFINILSINDSDNSIVGFGNENILAPFTVAGGSITISSPVDTYSLPAAPLTGFSWGTTYDAGTTGINGDLTPVPEPSTYAALAGIAALAMVAVRRRQRSA